MEKVEHIDAVFLKPLTVLRLRKNYKGTYKYPYINIDPKSAQTKRKFVSFIQDACSHWDDGTYYLKAADGVFAAFDLKDGKVKELHKESKYTLKEYNCWGYFKA